MDGVGDIATVELFFTESRQVRWSYGALKVLACYANGGIDLEVFLSAIRIGGATFEESEELSLSAQVGLAQTKLLLQARFSQRELWASGDVGVRMNGEWVFRQLEERILAW
jgi:hypothetical protein